MKTTAKIEYYGSEELLASLSKLGDNAPDVMAKALKESAKLPAEEMNQFMAQHRRTGLTEKSFNEGTPIIQGSKVILEFGYQVKQGGLAAIFLNLGGLHNPPYFFVDNALNHNIDKMKTIQEDIIKEEIKQCGLN